MMSSNVQQRSVGDRHWHRSRILNAWVDSLSVSDVLDLLEEGVLFTINPEHLYHLQRNAEFVQAYRDATYVACDSLYVHKALKLLGRRIEHRASGSDIVPAFWRKHASNPAVTIFLLGAKSGVAARALIRINKLAGREIVVGAHSPSFSLLDDEAETAEVIRLINDSGATCLIVGLGAPKQEVWIYRNRHRMPTVKVYMGVGATIDYEAGSVARAPTWMRQHGLEWIYRVVTEPRRYARRYMRNTEFLWLSLLDAFSLYKAPSFTSAVVETDVAQAHRSAQRSKTPSR